MEIKPPARLINDFSTERLSAKHWSSILRNDDKRRQLAETLTEILNPTVLEHLPPSLQVEQKTEAVFTWIKKRSDESDVYLVNMKESKTLIGLLILVNEPQSKTNLKFHIGYLFSQESWGKGYASELIKGLLQEARTDAPITLIGGVARGNGASAHILRKQGFSLEASLSDDDTDVFVSTLTKD